MAYPAGWPPRAESGRRSIRFYISGTGTNSFDDNAYLFSDNADANTYIPLPFVAPGSNTIVNIGSTPSGTGTIDPVSPHSMIWSNGIRVCNDSSIALGDDIFISFDGVHVHGIIHPEETVTYWDRIEAGIAVLGDKIRFHIEAW